MSDSDPTAIVGEAVLIDYPLRLWALQQEHTDELVREFTLLVTGEQSGATESSAPTKLVQLAEMFSTRFGKLIDAATSARQVEWDAGKDRMDWRVPLPAATPTLMRQVDAVLAEVDAYCEAGNLLALARPPEVVALQAWATAQLVAQFEGAEPTPWPGPW